MNSHILKIILLLFFSFSLFAQEKSKLTFDYSYIEYNEFDPAFESGNRFRLQWDISIF